MHHCIRVETETPELEEGDPILDQLEYMCLVCAQVIFLYMIAQLAPI
jgi:hypothetical protein